MTLIRESYGHLWRPFAIIAASAACVTSTALVVDGYKTAHSPIRPPDTPRVMAANGSATRHVVPDRIRWELTVSVHGNEQRDARRAATAATKKARAFLASHDVRENEITLLPVSLEQATRTVVHHTADGSEEEDDVPNGFDGTQTLLITSDDVGRIVAAYRAATAATELDTVDIAQPSCTSNSLASIERELLPEARLALRQRLDATLKTFGRIEVGRMVATDTGSVYAPGLTDASIETCEHGADVTLSTTATFELK